MRYAKCEIFIDRGGKRPPIAFFSFFNNILKKGNNKKLTVRKTNYMYTTNNESTKGFVKKCKLSQATIKAMEDGNKIYENFKNDSCHQKAYTLKEAIHEMKSW